MGTRKRWWNKATDVGYTRKMWVEQDEDRGFENARWKPVSECCNYITVIRVLSGGGANRLQLLPMFRLSTDGGQAEPTVLVRVIMTL